MFHLRLTAIALGAATTLGFVWLARARKKPQAHTEQPTEQPVDTDRLARGDAFRAFATEAEAELDDDAELEADAELDPGNEDSNVDVATFEEPLPTDEHYDAVDPEEMGAEWLSRALDAPSSRSEESDFADDGDALEEVPVGRVDADGRTALHHPHRRSKSSVDLSPNDDELAQRALDDDADDADAEETAKRDG